jgi:serine/threonine-protein kinase RsbW
MSPNMSSGAGDADEDSPHQLVAWRPDAVAPTHADGHDPLNISEAANAEDARRLRHTLQTWLEHHHVPEELRIDIALATNEAISNVVEHAYRDQPPGVVSLSARRTVKHVVVSVSDQGTWRPPPADPGSRGRGLAIIRAVATTVDVDTGPGGTTITACYLTE